MGFDSRSKEYIKLIAVSVLIGFLCALLGDSLKQLTAYCEDELSSFAASHWAMYILFPIIGLSVIHLSRVYFFKRKENRGIKEVFETLKTRHNELPLYKIPSHYINGFITVIFGGSTGIEVSTVVASATIGAEVQKRAKVHTAFRKELICAGAAAAIAALFNTPIAGMLFALEVISKRISRNAIISIAIASLTAWGFNLLINEKPLFKLTVTVWEYRVLPYFIVLGILSGIGAVYLTKMVLGFKKWFSGFKKYPSKIWIAVLILSILLLFVPQLYGDGYQAMQDGFVLCMKGASFKSISLVLLLAALLLKPIAASVTLAGGGDGGVFAPSLFMGAFLGFLFAMILNTFFGAHVVPINFMVIGMGAVLSGSLHAPFTSTFLVCGVMSNYVLIIPLLLACFISKYIAKLVYPYNVYTYLPAGKV